MVAFFLSKAAWAVIEPGNLLLILLVLGTVLQFTRKRGLGRALTVLAAIGFLAIAVLPLAGWVGAPLEERFPRAALPDRVDGIIMLGGAVNPRLGVVRGEPSLNEAAERVTGFVELALRYPEAKLVSSGGSGSVRHQDAKEDVAVRGVLDQIGFDQSRVIYENESRNTWENALYTQSLVQPRPGEVWVVVTSASHMPRSIGIFRRIGWPVLANPVDYRTYDSRFWLHFDLEENLDILSVMVREWLGLAIYRLMDRTTEFFPAP